MNKYLWYQDVFVTGSNKFMHISYPWPRRHDLLKCRVSLSHVKLCSNESDFLKLGNIKNLIVIQASMSRQSNYVSKCLRYSYSTVSSIMVEASLLPPFVSGIIYYTIHLVSTFDLMTKAAYTIKSLQILFLQRTLCGLDFQCDLSNIQTRLPWRLFVL